MNVGFSLREFTGNLPSPAYAAAPAPALADSRQPPAAQRASLQRAGTDSTQGQSAALIDDGIATGFTLEAAIRKVRADHPARLVVAVGVAPANTVARFRGLVDDFVAAQIPDDDAGAVGHRPEPIQRSHVQLDPDQYRRRPGSG